MDYLCVLSRVIYFSKMFRSKPFVSILIITLGSVVISPIFRSSDKLNFQQTSDFEEFDEEYVDEDVYDDEFGDNDEYEDDDADDDEYSNEEYNDEQTDFFDMLIDKRFVVKESISSGGYCGEVRNGIDLHTGEEVAIKIARTQLQKENLVEEYDNYIQLGADDPTITHKHFIPHVRFYGQFNNNTFIVTDKLGLSLEAILDHVDKFTLKTVILIGIQLINRLEYIHSRGLIYHDAKPANFLIGNTKETQNNIYVIDFGFSIKYLDEHGQPKPRHEAEYHNGTPEFMPMDPLNFFEFIRKDDLLSVGLVLLHLNGVEFPWYNLGKDYEHMVELMEVIAAHWEKTDYAELSSQSDDPVLFKTFFEYANQVEYDEDIDYEGLRNLFASRLSSEDEDKTLFVFEENMEDTDGENDSNHFQEVLYGNETVGWDEL